MRLAVALFVVPFVALSGCASLDQFDIELSSQAVIPGTFSQLPGVGYPGGFPGGAEIAQRIENQGVAPEDVRSAKLTRGGLKIISPETESLKYLQSFELFVEAEGLERKRIASVTLAGEPKQVDFALDDVELQPYVTAPEMKLVPQVERSALRPQADITIGIDLTLFVDLTLID